MHLDDMTLKFDEKIEAEIASRTRIPPDIFVNVLQMGSDTVLAAEFLPTNLAPHLGSSFLAVVLTLDVDLHPALRGKVFAANFTNERFQIFVNHSDMLRQVAFLSEPSLANLTLEALDLVVDRPHVNLQLALLCECLAAKLALELSDFLVNIFHMPPEVSVKSELHGT